MASKLYAVAATPETSSVAVKVADTLDMYHSSSPEVPLKVISVVGHVVSIMKVVLSTT